MGTIVSCSLQGQPSLQVWDWEDGKAEEETGSIYTEKQEKVLTEM